MDPYPQESELLPKFIAPVVLWIEAEASSKVPPKVPPAVAVRLDAET